MSKALLKSKAMRFTNRLVVRSLVMVCNMVIRAAVVEPDGRKAN